MELSKTNGTPFDAIKKVSDDGRETWSARELMIDVANYREWSNVKPAIERAVQAMNNVGITAGQHARPTRRAGGAIKGQTISTHRGWWVLFHTPKRREASGGPACRP